MRTTHGHEGEKKSPDINREKGRNIIIKGVQAASHTSFPCSGAGKDDVIGVYIFFNLSLCDSCKRRDAGRSTSWGGRRMMSCLNSSILFGLGESTALYVGVRMMHTAGYMCNICTSELQDFFCIIHLYWKTFANLCGQIYLLYHYYFFIFVAFCLYFDGIQSKVGMKGEERKEE